MKVLYVVPYYPDSNTAASVRLNQIIPYLNEQTELKILGLTEPNNQNGNGLENMVTAPQGVASSSNLVKGVFSKYPDVLRRFSNENARKIFTEIEKEFKPDIVHFDTFGCTGLARYSQTKNKVFHIHDCISKKYSGWIKSEKSVSKKIYYSMQERKARYTEMRLFPENGVCIVDSEEDAELLRKETGATVEVIPLGFDQKVYHPDGDSVSSIPKESLIFSGSMASLQTLVGVRWLINEIMPRVWKELPNAKIYLAGSKPQAEIKAFEEKDNRVIVTGFVEDLSAYLRSTTAYVCTLKIGSGMKTRVVEALATGCAMVTTPQGVSGLKRENPLPWLEAENPDDFAASIIKLMKDENLQKTLSTNAATFAKRNYSWKTTSEKILNVYSKLIKG